MEKDLKYGLPDKKKFPMPDRKHVLSAIKFFNYATPYEEEELAKAILSRMREYGIKEVNVGDDNRFKKYYEKTLVKHYGIPGQKKGRRRYQDKNGHRTAEGVKRYDSPKARIIETAISDGYPQDQAVAIALKSTNKTSRDKKPSIKKFLEEQVAKEGLTGRRAEAQVRYRQRVLKEKGDEFLEAYIIGDVTL